MTMAKMVLEKNYCICCRKWRLRTSSSSFASGTVASRSAPSSSKVVSFIGSSSSGLESCLIRYSRKYTKKKYQRLILIFSLTLTL